MLEPEDVGQAEEVGQPEERRAAGGAPGEPDRQQPTAVLDHRWRTAALIATGVLVAVGIALRFWTRSDMWLDEALTVDIAKQPLHLLPTYLRHDGAPPLYYALLHFWMGAFGTSDLGARSLSGVIGVVTLPLTWLAAKRLGGSRAGWIALVLVATNPFAVYYDTESRMYALVVLLTVLGVLALLRCFDRPRPGNLVAIGAVTAALLYTHYWSMYLIGVVALWLLYQAWRGSDRLRRPARSAFVAMVVGALAFVPWLPTFAYQSAHTGTPWAIPANFAAMVHAISEFAGGATSAGRALGLIFFAVAGLGLFGVAMDHRRIELDLRGRSRGRSLALVIAGTLAAAIAGGFISRSAFSARYASVVFIPLILLVALGFLTFADRRIRIGVLAVALAAGLAGCASNVTTNRTQAGQVATALARVGHAGDVVAYCPDQLGPAVNRLLPAGRYQQTTFPRGTGPQFVDWVDYQQASAAGNPGAFARRLLAMAGPTHQIFYVWEGGYETFGTKCEQVLTALAINPAFTSRTLVLSAGKQFYEPMNLVQLSPKHP